MVGTGREPGVAFTCLNERKLNESSLAPEGDDGAVVVVGTASELDSREPLPSINSEDRFFAAPGLSRSDWGCGWVDTLTGRTVGGVPAVSDAEPRSSNGRL